MKLRNLFLSAIAMIVAFSACDDKTEDVIGGTPSIELVDFEGDEITFGADGGERQVALLANRNWTIEEDASWIEVTPKSGSAAADQQTVTIKVVKNELDEDDPTAGFDREADLKFTVGAKSVYLTVKQEGPQGSTEALIVYYNNFDKEKAEKGENGWATYLDSYEGWKNATGTGVETVTYEFDRMTARTNSNNGSAGSYSIYEGSGMNYLWFGSGKPYFAVKDITLPEGKVNFTVSFGSERYLYEAEDNTFNFDEFKAYASIDGVKWTVLDWKFAGEELPDGKWDLASATIKVPEGTQKLSLFFTASLASAYAIDDVRVEESLTEGIVVDFAAGEELNPEEGEQGGESDATAIYSNNYDKQEATKTYGSSGSSYPYLDQFDGWRNHAGTGSENVTYSYKGVSVRSNSTSDSSYSDYAGSGLNNIFFGSNAYFSTNNIALNGATTLTLTFGTEKYDGNNKSAQFDPKEYHVFLSNDGEKWVEISYVFAGTTAGRWNVATANFTVPSGTETLSICMQVDVASVYRLDDFKLVSGTEAGTTVDFSQAVEKDFGAGSSTGGGTTPEGTGEGTQASPYDAAKAHNVAATLADGEKITGVYVKGKITEIKEVSTSYGNATYYITDATGAAKFYVYRGYALGNEKFTSEDEIKVGDEVLVYGDLMNYKGNSPQLGQGNYIVELNGGAGDGGNDPEPELPGVGEGTQASPYDAAKAHNVAATLADGEKITGVYVKGKISEITEVSTSYGNATYYITDETGAAKFYVYRGYALGNEKFTSEDEIKVGDEVLVYGDLMNYKGNSPQLGQGNYIVELNGGAGDGGNDPEPELPGVGEGTQASPYDAAKAHNVAATLADGEKITGVYVKGKISEITEVSTSYGNATYYITDETGAAKFYVYRGYALGNVKFTSEDEIKVGDEVLIYGDLMNYKGNSPQLGQGNYIVELNSGSGGGGEEPEPEDPVDPSEVQVVTVADFLAAAEDETVYELTGTITRIATAYSSQYNNITYYIADETGETYVYRMSCEGVADPLSLSAGDEITVQGKRSSYNGVAQMAQGGKYISHVDKEAPAPEVGTYTLDFSDVANRTSLTTTEQIWEQNGIRLTNNKASSTSNVADYSAPARFYKSTSLKIEKEGMNKMVFLCNSGKNTGPADLKASVTDANATVTVEGMTVTITFATSVDVFEIATLAGQVRVDLLTVYAE